MEELKKIVRTGDIILFDSTANGIFKYIEYGIRLFTHSSYNHVAMILVNPTFMAELTGSSKDKYIGYFIWESSWEGEPDPQDGKVKMGVQLTPLEEIIKNNRGKVIIRKLVCSNELYEQTFTDENLKEIHEMVYDKPYDLNIFDWIGALFRLDFSPKKKDRYWCSALIGAIYNKLGIINENIDWSILRPSDFSIEDKKLHIEFNDGYKLDEKQFEFCF